MERLAFEKLACLQRRLNTKLAGGGGNLGQFVRCPSEEGSCVTGFGKRFENTVQVRRWVGEGRGGEKKFFFLFSICQNHNLQQISHNSLKNSSFTETKMEVAQESEEKLISPAHVFKISFSTAC